MFRVILMLSFMIVYSAGSAEAADEPASGMVVLRSTLKSWRSMYTSYREEIGLGYCWADYFVDFNNFINTLTGPRLLGVNANDQMPVVKILKNWFVDGKYDLAEDKIDEDYAEGLKDDLAPSNEFSNSDDVENPAPTEKQLDTNLIDRRFIYPGFYKFDGGNAERTKRDLSSSEDSRSLVLKPSKDNKEALNDDNSISSRGLSDLFISALGFNTPPALGPLMIGVKQTPSIVIVISRIIGTFFRVGRQVLHDIETTSILSCTKDYLLGKMFRWIDS